MVGPFLPDAEKLAAIRELLPATSAGIFLNAADAGPLPAETARAMAEAADWELRTGRAHEAYRAEQTARLDEARGVLAAVIGAGVDTVSIAHSAADALAALVAAVRPRRAVVSDASAPPVLARVGALAAAMGTPMVVVEDGLPQAFSEGDLVVLPHVTDDGRVLAVADMVRAAAEVGARVAVDGSLAVGAVPVDVEALGVDAYAVDAHRWLLGPAGMGAIHVRGPERDAVRDALEGSAFYGPSVLGMARSAGWLAMYVGLDWITRRTVALARDLADRLAATAGVELLTPSPVGAGIVAFRMSGWPDSAGADALERRSFAIVGRGAQGLIRASVGAWTTEAELDRFAAAVELVAGHSPQTLPQRPPLTILHEPGQ